MKRTIKAVLLLLWMGMIFYFSAQPAADSTVTSNSTAMLLYRIYRFLGLHGASEYDFLETYMPVIRKTAHLIEFMILGILVTVNVREYKNKNALLWTLLLSSAYAISDELHQLFVINRSCEIRDMLIDCLGAYVGIFLCHMFYEWKK